MFGALGDSCLLVMFMKMERDELGEKQGPICGSDALAAGIMEEEAGCLWAVAGEWWLRTVWGLAPSAEEVCGTHEVTAIMEHKEGDWATLHEINANASTWML